MYQWDYIDQMNGLLDSKIEGLTPSELQLYLILFRENNSEHRVEWFSLKNRMLSGFIDKDEKSMIRIRNSLKQKGLIDFVQGKKGQPTKYKLILLYHQKNTGKNASTNASESTPQSQNLRGFQDPLKGKGKGKDNNTPLTPQRGNAEERFKQFWAAYPKKQAKGAAEKAFTKIRPNEALLEQMLEAIERQKKSMQWQKDGGQYIPMPSTWLNQRRWEDELTGSPQQQAGDRQNGWKVV